MVLNKIIIYILIGASVFKLTIVMELGYVEASSPAGSNRSWKSMEMEIQSSLEKLLDINDAMSRCAASAAPTTSVTQKLARHRDILHEFSQEFRRIKGNINSMWEHAELLSSVREDISESKASGSGSPRVQLLRERASIHGSISHIDDVINQAQSTRSALASQRTLFGDVQGKVKLLGDKFPVQSGERNQETLLYYLQSSQPVRCFLSSIGFRNKQKSDLLNRPARSGFEKKSVLCVVHVKTSEFPDLSAVFSSFSLHFFYDIKYRIIDR
ncbi:hypothetical protein Leryth_024658 [Lithospermum erythrorhizon]|nr:hypothetical protein Leryth_024658 [Lithospermum erythrorhizon]